MLSGAPAPGRSSPFALGDRTPQGLDPKLEHGRAISDRAVRGVENLDWETEPVWFSPAAKILPQPKLSKVNFGGPGET